VIQIVKKPDRMSEKRPIRLFEMPDACDAYFCRLIHLATHPSTVDGDSYDTMDKFRESDVYVNFALDTLGFHDFAGLTLVHAVGGAATLVVAWSVSPLGQMWSTPGTPSFHHGHAAYPDFMIKNN
jgi:hypothetical protein